MCHDITNHTAINLTLVRHGQTYWNAASPTVADEQDLTSLGVDQVTQTAARLQGEQFDALYASALPRALQTATILRQELGLRLDIQQTALLNERDYGTVQPRKSPVAKGGGYDPYAYPEFLILSDEQRWPWKPYEDFESDAAMLRRYINFMNIIQKSGKKNVLAATHAGFMRIVLMHHEFTNHNEWNKFAVHNADAYLIHHCSNGVTVEPLVVN